MGIITGIRFFRLKNFKSHIAKFEAEISKYRICLAFIVDWFAVCAIILLYETFFSSHAIP